jgi:hypothetical protein
VIGAIFDTFGDPDRNAASRALTWLAHVAMPVAVVMLVINAIDWFYDIPDWIGLTIAVIQFVVIVIAALHQDIGRICVRCMQEVPADAPVRAQRRRWLLRFWHFSMTRGYWLALACVIFVPAAIQVLFFETTRATWMNAPGDLFVFAYIWALWSHHRLTPWCPYCRRWDDGGAHEPSPDPVPEGTKSR